MEHNIITLTTRAELNVYMSPVRQALLRALALAREPLTPKALSDKLGISPSSVQHHIKKLLALGVVEVDHKAVINGITATYYKPALVEVRMGLDRGDSLREEREALSTSLVGETLQGFYRVARNPAGLPAGELAEYGELLSGVAHLAPEERRDFFAHVKAFLAAHESPGQGRTEHWAFALVAYREQEGA